MKAIVYERYGPPDVLELREVPTPEATADRVLIRIRATSLNRSDYEALTARPAYVRLGGSGFRRPRQPILGSDVAGVVEAVGPDVTEYRPGDEVFGDLLYHGAGGFAEYVAVRERALLARKPAAITFEQAAAIPQGGVLALHGLRGAEPGDRVLIVGAGGGAGSFAVQIAKSLGAEVTGVDSGLKFDLMRSLGADHVVDHTRSNYSRGGERYDRILDFAGRQSIFSNRRALAKGGTYRMVGGTMPRLLQAATVGWAISKAGSKHMGMLLARPAAEDLVHLADLVAASELACAIERIYPLEDVPDAMRHLGDKRALGKLVVTM